MIPVFGLIRLMVIGLGHTRLSIIDISPLPGISPWCPADQRYVLDVQWRDLQLSLSLKKQLESDSSRRTGKAIRILRCFFSLVQAYGLRKTLGLLEGMFAFALYDKAKRRLHLVRDRLGEKPLCYAVIGERLFFASTLFALRAVLKQELTIDRNSVALFCRHNYVPGPYSIYQQARKLPTAHWLELDLENQDCLQNLKPKPYWSVNWQKTEAGLTESEIADHLESLLSDSIRQCMMSDVPLGCFLSGGIDSTLVTALMQKHSARPVKTFSIGFREDAFSEARHAKAVAEHLGTDHTELYVTARDAMTVIQDLQSVYDEPFSDSSQIPTLIVSRLARQHVTVALSGGRWR